MFKLKLLALFLLVCTLSSWSLAVAQSRSVEFRIIYDSSKNSVHTTFINNLKTLFKQELGTQYRLVLVPYNGDLNGAEALELLFSDAVDVALPSLTDISLHAPRFKIFDLPFLFSNENSAKAFVHGDYGSRLANSLSSIGLKGFSYLDNGMKQLVSNKQILQPFDLVGLKVGTVGSEVLHQQYIQMGGVSVSMKPQALRQYLLDKKITAHENTWQGVYDVELAPLQPFIFESDHAYMGFLITMRKKLWDMHKESQQAIEKVFRQAAIESNRSNNLRMLNSKQFVKDSKKFEIKTPSAEERRVWVDSFKKIWDIFEEDIGLDLITTAASNRW